MKFRIVKRNVKTFFGYFDRFEIHEQKSFAGFEGPLWIDAEFNQGKSYKSFQDADAALATYFRRDEPDFKVIKEYEF